MLDAVRHAEFFEGQDELTQFFNEPVLIFDRGGGEKQQNVVGEVVEAVRVREDDERGGEFRVPSRRSLRRWCSPYNGKQIGVFEGF